jgi:clan AA aspartic protease (TIGR02281 family)
MPVRLAFASLLVWLAFASLLWLVAAPAEAQIYRWTDEEGRLHATSDPSQVPARHRGAAEAAAKAAPGQDRLQRFESPTRSSGRARSGKKRPANAVYTIPVERAGSTLRVVATLNGGVVAPFLIDTGASDVVIPRAVADRLGLAITEDTRTQLYQTANGIVEAPVVVLDSISLGGAVAEGVSASVSDQMSVGLLGLSFFNRFSYHVDPAAGLLSLRPNRLVEEGVLRGGRSESDWRIAFGQLRERIDLVEERMSGLPPSRTRLLADLAGERDKLEAQVVELEIEADRAGVPQPWRE